MLYERGWLLVDEVQLCDGFEKAINSLHASEKYDNFCTNGDLRIILIKLNGDLRKN